MHWSKTATNGDEYDSRFEDRVAAGHDVHGEAAFVMRFGPRSVLDAGCGTGRVARELARRGVEVAGVDRDNGMLSTAERKAPHLVWHLADLAEFDLERKFDLVILAGNVLIFLDPGTEQLVLANCRRHLAAGGTLISGFQLLPERLSLAAYDAAAQSAGLGLIERYATWDGAAWQLGSEYVVSVHRAG